MAKVLQLPPPLEGDISLRTLGRLAGRLDNIDLSVLMVGLVDIVDSSALPWLGEQFSLFGDGWELAESDDVRRMLIKSAIELHRYKGTPWSIREIIRRFGFGEVDLIEGTGQIGYDGRHTYNGLFVHGDAQAWQSIASSFNNPSLTIRRRCYVRRLLPLLRLAVIWQVWNISLSPFDTTVLPVMTVVTTTGAVNYGKSTRNPAVGKRHLPD